MKEFFSSPYLIYPLIITGMIAEFKYNLEWAGNVSLFCLWSLILIAFMALLVDSKELFKKKSNNAKMLLCALCLLVQIAIGWIFTAVFFAIGWFFLLVKKAAYYQELEKAN
jgi:hypothetical protein